MKILDTGSERVTVAVKLLAEISVLNADMVIS
jgi:hypothetical protein